MLQALAPIPAILAAAVVRTDRRIVQELRSAQATTADRAINLGASSRLRAVRIERLTRLGCLHALPDDRRYLDEAGWERWRVVRRTRVFAVVLTVLVVTAFVLIAFRSGSPHKMLPP